MPHKILFLTPWYPDSALPHHGVFVRDQAGTVASAHKVCVISSKIDYGSFGLFSWTLSETEFKNIREYRLVMRRSLPFVNQVNYLLLSVWISFRISKSFRPDIIHGNIAYPGAIWGYVLSRLTSRPFIVSDHTSRFTDNFRSALHRILTVFALRRAHSVIAVSTWAAANIESVVRRKVIVIPNVIHVDDYAVSHPANDVPQIGFLGGLSSEIHRKGLDLLIKAMEPLRENFVIHVGGQGKYLEHYREMARNAGLAEKFRFHGFVGHVPDFMKGLDFFVSSSRIEAFGMVIVEAMASGLPVVATDSGGPSDYMVKECGLLIPSEDDSALREAMVWMLRNHKSFDRDAIANRVRDKFSAAAFLKRIDKVYQRLVTRDPETPVSR